MKDELILIAKSKNHKKQSPVVSVKRDGWVITKDKAYGDNGEDCEIVLDVTKWLKKVRFIHGMSQQEMAWVLGITRTTYINLEQGKRELTLKEYMLIEKIVIKPEQVNRFRK